VNVPELLHRITLVLEKNGKAVSPGKIWTAYWQQTWKLT
jgi:hypothetical protein